MISRILILLFLGLPCLIRAQADTLPVIVSQPIDWTKVKAFAPKFQQKDLVVRIVRLNNLMQVFEREGSPAWQDDWHFLELTGDRYIEGLFSGKTKFHKGWHTYFTLGDSALKFPVKFDAPGYIATLKYDKESLELILRDDPGEGEYITDITHYYLRTDRDSIDSRWQVRFVSTTEIPALGKPELHTLKMPMHLRTGPREIREPAIDYDGDGKPDGAGNVVAELAKGSKLLRYAVHREGDLEWSFVMVMNPPAASSVLKPLDRKNVLYAGWIPSGAFL